MRSQRTPRRRLTRMQSSEHRASKTAVSRGSSRSDRLRCTKAASRAKRATAAEVAMATRAIAAAIVRERAAVGATVGATAAMPGGTGGAASTPASALSATGRRKWRTRWRESARALGRIRVAPADAGRPSTATRGGLQLATPGPAAANMAAQSAASTNGAGAGNGTL